MPVKIKFTFFLSLKNISFIPFFFKSTDCISDDNNGDANNRGNGICERDAVKEKGQALHRYSFFITLHLKQGAGVIIVAQIFFN